ILFVRSVMLARLLPVETFGVYALAGSIVTLSVTLPNFGLGGAFLHRAPETEDEGQAAATHFTLKAILTLVWAAVLALGALVFATGEIRVALLLLTATTAGVELTQTYWLILVRRVVHRRLALLQLIQVLLTTVAALSLAWNGATLWALLTTDIVALAVTFVGLCLWRPVWRPHLAWSPDRVRYFLHFGSRNFVAAVLLRTLDRVDDLWAGFYLGKTALGFYAKAYTFATYPRRVLAVPVNQVVRGTYAALKGDRQRLSQAFFRTNALLVRSGFFLAGLLALIAPEFIRLLLTDKWLPMLDAFRLMLVFTLLDPLKISISHVLVAVGRPEQVMRARLVQLVILVIGLFSLGPWLGIAGVALAVDLMLAVGIGILLWMVRAYVDFSLARLFAAPGLALTLGLILGGAVSRLPGVSGNDWLSAFGKAVVFSSVYAGVLVWMERAVMFQMFDVLRKSTRPLRG
ncbi:hypothetical protein D6833_01280, partial [Candidatus Parcubacteria bacterium]